MKGPGGRFEAEIQASIPRKSRAGRLVSIEKRHDPPTRGTGGRCRRCKGQLVTICSTCRQAPKGAARFTARQPYDFEVIAPWRTTDPEGWPGPDGQGFQPSIVFAFECKRTSTPSLPFSALAEHQRKGLARIAAAGGVAGVLWLVEQPKAPPRCCFIESRAVESYIAGQERLAAVGAASRKSIPLSVLSTRVEVDPDRGRTNRYWELADLLRRYGADV